MDKDNKNRLKKYLLFISIFFAFLTWSHIIYSYVYFEANELPVEWGSISEAIIWDFPHLNPLIASNDYNKNIIHILYRSLMNYDYEKNEFVWDIAKCDIQNMASIKCYLSDDALWSNGEKITPNDIIATYNILKNSDINPAIANLLKDTSIENSSGVVVFTNKVKNINFLYVLLQPIVSKDILDNIWNKELYWKFNPIGGVYSGPYRVDAISYDDEISGIQRLILSKNEHYTLKNILIAKYTFRIFKDKQHFLKHKDNINIFLDKDKILWSSIPRLQEYTYTLPQYNTLFLNEESIKSRDLRRFILSTIDRSNIIKTLGKWYMSAESVFLDNSLSLDAEKTNVNIVNILKEAGYYKKEDLVDFLIEETKQADEKEKITNSNLTYITSPVNTQFSFIWESNILIEWNTLWKNPSAIYVNGYKLAWYNSWDEKFYYRLNTEIGNFYPWLNTLKIEFEIWSNKQKVEELYITYSSEKEKLERLKKEFEEKLTQSQKTTQITQEDKDAILDLENNAFYDKEKNKFSLNMYYLEKDDIAQAANIIKNTLASYGLHTEITPISLSNLNKKITSGEKNYDMILLWLDVGYFPFNLYPYLHSSQAKEWYNLSNTKNLNLDIILEEVQSNIFSPEKTKELTQKINEILQEKQVIFPLFQKEYTLLVDKNIKNFSFPNTLTNEVWVWDFILKWYITSEKQVDISNKSFSQFIKFISQSFSHD